MYISKRPVILTFAATLTVMCAAGLAWACTSQSQIMIVPGIIARADEAAVTESSRGVQLSPGPVTITWNAPNGAQDGLELATVNLAEGQRLNSSVRIPDVPPGVYYVVVTSGDRVARTAVQVTSPGTVASSGSEVSADLWQGFGKDSTSVDLPAEASSPAPSAGRLTGFSLVGLAAVAMFAGVGFAARRRRAERKS